MPKISVVLPVYNGEKYLEQSIKSIIEQDFEDWELIIVNDASTDGTKDIISKYISLDSRIKSINNNKNAGISNSLNKGFSVASGDFFTWTSDDNRYLKSALSVLAKELELNENVDFVYSNSYVINENGDRTGELNLKNDFFYNDCFGACFMYRREKAEQIDGYNPNWSLIQDYEYWFRLKQICNVKFIETYLYEYRRHSENLTSTQCVKMRRQLDELRFERLDYILDNISAQYYEALFIDLYLINKKRQGELITKFWGSLDKVPENLSWLFNRKNNNCGKKYIVFGCGDYGKKTVDLVGKDNIAYFIDNNINRVGEKIKGITVVGYDDYLRLREEYELIVAISSVHIQEVVNQLFEDGVNNFITYLELCDKN